MMEKRPHPGSSEESIKKVKADVKTTTAGGTEDLNYVCGKLLGQGGMGALYECVGDSSRVIKKIPFDRTKDYAGEALMTEIEVIRKLDHESIVHYFGSYRSDNHVCILLERMSGGSLRDHLDQSGAFEENRARKYTRQILAGLEYLHERGIVHEDLKGSNVLLDAGDDIKLCDFGIAKVVVLTTGQNTLIDATTRWQAPEKYRGVFGDIWSLGCTVVEMLTTKPPCNDPGNERGISDIAGVAQPIYDLPSTTSQAAREFLKLCFTMDTKVRPTAKFLTETGYIQGMSFQCGEVLGEGGFGAVYECRGDISRAIKKIPIDKDAKLAAVQNEIEIISNLEHQRIVQYFGSEHDSNNFYIILERMPRGSLKDQLDRTGAFDETRSQKYTSQVLNGLEYLHREKLVHRDVKAANVLLGASDDIKLCDFGIATVLEEATKIITTEAKGQTGTLLWIAPEVFGPDGHGRKSDIW